MSTSWIGLNLLIKKISKWLNTDAANFNTEDNNARKVSYVFERLYRIIQE